MYIPQAFRDEDLPSLHATMRASRLSNLVTATAEGLIATPLPFLLAADEGPYGTLYGHIAKANPQCRLPPVGEAMAIFMGPDAYITPSWYATKAETHKVVPTWNYVAVHAYGSTEFFDDAARLHDAVAQLTDHYEAGRSAPWAVSDAPEAFVQAQLRGIVGVRMPITRLDGKRKMSQNRNAEDRAGVVKGLGERDDADDRLIATFIPGSDPARADT